MSFNVGGILVGDHNGRKRITSVAVAKAIEAYWTKRGAKKSKRKPAAIEPLTIANGGNDLAYAVLAPTGGYIAVADSERYHADHALARHLAKALGTEVLWYTLYGATSAGIARWFGTQRKAPPATYGDVEDYVQDYPNACVYFDQLDDADHLFALSGVTGYSIGPIPDDDPEDDEGDPQPTGAGASIDANKRAPFPPIVIQNRAGTAIAGRTTLTLGFSCVVPIQKMAKAALAALDLYLATVPGDALCSSLLGSSSTTIGSLKVARARGLLAKPKPNKKIYFFLQGGSTDTQAPSWVFLCNGEDDVTPKKMSWGWLRRSTQIEMRFPSDFLWQLGADKFVDLAGKFAALLPYDSGFASIAITWCPLLSTTSQDAPMLAAPALLAHDGLDIHQEAFRLGGHCRGATWLTMLGPGLVDKLGGKTALAGIDVRDAGKGVMLRAGEAPLLDLPARDRALFESVARAVKPVTLFDCDNRIGFDDDAAKARWLYRFVGGPD